MHSFIDSSGCVFLNTFSGETLSVGLTQFDLAKIISSKKTYDNSKITVDTITTLVDKGFLKPFDHQNSHVE
jgi:hypothetical protein